MFGRPLRAGFRAAPLGERGPIRTQRSSQMPAWWRAATVGQWVAISGTGSGVGDVDAFCGWGVKQDTSDIYVIAAGGHTNSGSNAVQRLRLLDDAPAWAERRASDWDGVEVNISHYASGSPAARHTYHTTQWTPSIGRFLLIGAPYVKGGAAENYPTVDGYDPATDSFDAAGTYTSVLRVSEPSGPYGFGVAQDGDGNIWASHDRRYNPNTDTWDYPSVTGRVGMNFPQSYSSTRDEIFALQWGDGTAGTGMTARRRDMATLTDSTITFSAGSASAVSQFATDTPVYAGMDWDADNARWLFYAGGARVYSITPNAGTEWDMAILSTTGTAPGAAGAGGINSKWTYVSALTGFVAMPTASGGIFFLRMA